jgi:hypothetical protein
MKVKICSWLLLILLLVFCLFLLCGGELSRAAIVGDFPELSRTAATVSFASLEPSETDGDHIKQNRAWQAKSFAKKKTKLILQIRN